MERSISFWRRIGAYYLDSFLLVCTAAILGYPFRSFWAQHDVLAFLFGLALMIAYFTVCHSTILGGQTAGKYLLNIRVVGRDCRSLSLAQSLIRALVVNMPFTVMVWVAVFPSMTAFKTYAYWFAYSAFSLCSLYLFVFNRQTRQCIHDMLVGSYVVLEDAESLPNVPFWRGHVVAPILIFLLSLLFATPDVNSLKTEAFHLGQQLGQSLDGSPGVVRSVALVEPRSSISGSRKLGEIGLVKIRIQVDSVDRFRRSFVDELSDHLLDQYPQLRSADELQYVLNYGFHMGAYSHSDHRSFSIKPKSRLAGEVDDNEELAAMIKTTP